MIIIIIIIIIIIYEFLMLNGVSLYSIFSGFCFTFAITYALNRFKFSFVYPIAVTGVTIIIFLRCS